MQVDKNKVVALAYDLQVMDAENSKVLVEKVDKMHPMFFLFGVSGLPEKFEEYLKGLYSGDKFEFSVESDDAYGDFDDESVVNIPLDVFKVDNKFDSEKFKVGAIIPMSDENGHTMRGKILEVSEEDIKMDFNHPLAGKDLYFTGEVVSVRDATQEELAHGHVHGEGGHHH